jgi:hypothetical protein
VFGLVLEETHRRLAKELGKALGLNSSHQRMLEEGSVLPDYQESFPHHIKKEKEIRNLLHRSRVTFLKGDDECYSLLGMTFHYIQDKWTFRARTRDKHTKWEQLINESELLDEKTLTENIQTATIPLKFKEAYLGFLKVVNSDIESPLFWGHLVDEDGRSDPDRSIWEW